MDNIKKNEAETYLREKLTPFVGDNSVDVIVGYLSSFDIRNGQNDMILYLEELCGKNPIFNEFIANYARILFGVTINERGIVKVVVEKEKYSKSDKSTKSMEPHKKAADNFSVKNEKQPSNKSQKSKKDINQFAKLPVKSTGMICNCMATSHNFYSNCNYCGRIICDQQGPGCCPFCGSVVVPPKSSKDVELQGADSSTIEAYRHKDKLLIFDRENAKRTVVHDSQADYYETGTWLSTEEKKAIEVKEAERRKGLSSRSNKSVKITFDLAGRRVTEMTSDNNDEEDDVEAMSEPTNARIKNFTVLSLDNVELVSATSKVGTVYRDVLQSLVTRSSTNININSNTSSVDKSGSSREEVKKYLDSKGPLSPMVLLPHTAASSSSSINQLSSMIRKKLRVQHDIIEDEAIEVGGVASSSNNSGGGGGGVRATSGRGSLFLLSNDGIRNEKDIDGNCMQMQTTTTNISLETNKKKGVVGKKKK